MSSNNKVVIWFGDKSFVDVTNTTVCSETFSYREAKIYGETGEKIASSD